MSETPERHYMLVCPGVNENGRGLTTTIVHAAGCCERFAVLDQAAREVQGLRVPVCRGERRA